jgi:glycosyltransferase involved in cell wall biosynthesis
MDFLLFSSTDWDGVWGSRQQVARELARRNNRVLFIEQMAGLEHFAKYPDLRHRRRQRWQTGLQAIEENLWLATPPPLLPGRYYVPAIARLNAWIITLWLRPILRRLYFTQPILWLYQPEQVFLVQKFNEQALVYHCIDEFTVGTSGRKRAVIAHLEELLLRQADVVFANSQLTFERKRPFNPHTYRIPSGVNVAHFASAGRDDLPPHTAVAHLPHPILMFVGNVCEKLDAPLLEQIARDHPQASLVLVGQIFPDTIDLSRLRQYANVHLLGKFPFAEVPALLQSADLCLLPYVQNEDALFRSPLKLYEYLATGKPILSTPHPEVAEFANFVTIASLDEFSDQIDLVLAADTGSNKKERLTEAENHSWQKRVDVMLANLAEARRNETE